MTQSTFSPSQEMETMIKQDAQSPNAQSTMEGAKKKKKSHKMKNIDPSLQAPESNGLTSSPAHEEEQPREKKRKRKSEPGQKKQKKHKRDRTEDNNQNDEAMATAGEDEQAQMELELPASNNSRPSSVNGLEETSEDAPDASNPPTSEIGFNKKGQPRKLRGSRIGGKNNLKVGFYTKEEVQKLENHKVNFCNLHNISDHKVFDSMVQHSERTGAEHRSAYDWPCPADECTKAEFWAEIYSLLPDRDRRSLYRFMRRHFQDSTQKPHEWTPEQDEELVRLMTLHPGKWSYVAKLIGRSDDDVTQRWKNQLEHRGKMNRGKWSAEEIQSLLDTIQEIWNRLYATEGDTAGKDMYEIDEKYLRWGPVSDALGNVRSRQQCADKWRKVKKQVEIMRSAGNPDAQFDPIEAAGKATRWSLSASGTPKSNYQVVDEEDDDNDESNHKPNHTANENTAPRIGFGIFTGTPEPDAKSAASEQASESESDAGVEPASSAVAPSSPPPSSPNGAADDASASKKRKHSETDQPTETKKERRERKARRKQERKERKERKERERAAAGVPETLNETPRSNKKEKKNKKSKKSLDPAGADSVAEGHIASSTPQKKKKNKKDRKSIDVNGAIDEQASPESSKKKSKKSRQSNEAKSIHEENDVNMKYEGPESVSD